MAYDDNILIKLKRDYAHDETILYLINHLKKERLENGKLKDYIDELKNKIIEYKNNIKKLNIKSNTKPHEILNLKSDLKKANFEKEQLKLKLSELRKTKTI